MKKITLKGVFSAALMVACFTSFGQSKWIEAPTSKNLHELVQLNNSHRLEKNIPTNSKIFSIDINSLSNEFSSAPQRNQYSGNSNTIISIPNADGEMMRYRIEEASVFAPELQAQYPEIRSYAGQGIDDPTAYLRFSVSPYKGFSGIVISGQTNGSMILEPLKDDASKVAVYRRSAKNKKAGFICSTEDNFDSLAEKVQGGNAVFAADDSILREFDLALSVTGEYTAYHGGTLVGANAAIAATMTRVNGVFENDFNVTLKLIAGNDAIVYTNAATDPYSPSATGQNAHATWGGAPWFAVNWQVELQDDVLTPVIGEGNYDIGHLFGDSGGGGNAGCIGCICNSAVHIGGKGSAYTSPGDGIPEGDNFDIDYVAHEMGHQFGGRHTFSHSSEGAGIAQMEPGSGSTIMGYAGITGATDVQPHSDPYFHAITIQQVTTHAKSRTCDVETNTGNNTPVVNAGANITLPIGTAFKLDGSATDADVSETLTYCWEQYNEDNASNAYPDPASTSNDRPLFRSYSPSTSTERVFPLMADLVANGVNGNTWEKVPTVNRTGDFRLTVRDNRAGGANNSFGDMVVTWDNSYGPFQVTTQNTALLSYNKAEVITVSWDVNNTTALPGSTNVNILLSTDGGVTYPIALATNVPNDGTEDVALPNSAHEQCRVMIEPTANQYFAINGQDFAIGYDVTTGTVCTTYNFNINTTLGANAAAFELFGSQNVSDSGTITDVNVQFDMSGLNSGMHMALLAPDNTRAYLYANACATGSNMQVVWDDEAGAGVVCGNDPTVGTHTPSGGEALNLLDGKEMNGDWTFMAANIAADVKVFNTVALEICRTDNIYTLGVGDVVAFDSFNIYPIPNRGNFTIDLSSTSSNDISVFVHDVRGRKVYGDSFNNTGSFNKEIQLSGVQKGLYIVTVTDGERKEFKKIIIE